MLSTLSTWQHCVSWFWWPSLFEVEVPDPTLGTQARGQWLLWPLHHPRSCRAREWSGDWGTVDELMANYMLKEPFGCNCKPPVVAFACWSRGFVGGQQTTQVGGLLVGLEVCSDLGTSLSLSLQDHWSILMHPDTLLWDFCTAFHHSVIQLCSALGSVHFRCSHPLKVWICKLWRYLGSKMVEGSSSRDFWLAVVCN